MDSREVKGKAIAESKQVMRLEDGFYKVASQSRDLSYDVIKKRTGWICSCPDHVHRQVRCKHIWAVQFSLAVRKIVQARVIEPITDAHMPLLQIREDRERWTKA